MYFYPPEDKGVTIVFVRRENTEDKGVTIPRTKPGPHKRPTTLNPNLSLRVTTAFILHIQ